MAKALDPLLRGTGKGRRYVTRAQRRQLREIEKARQAMLLMKAHLSTPQDESK